MEPIITELDVKKTLLNPIAFQGETLSEVSVKRLIIRPVMKRIVVITTEMDRVIVYDGEELFEAHKGDSQEAILDAMLSKIDSENKA